MRFFKNVSNRFFCFPEINDRKVLPNPDTIHSFEESEIERSDFLQALIEKEQMLEIDAEEALSTRKESMIEKLGIDPKKDIDSFSFGDVPKEQEKKKDERLAGPKDVWWTGPVIDMGGYGKMNRYCVTGLYERGFNVQIKMGNIPNVRAVVPETKKVKEMLSNEVPSSANSIWAVLPPKYPSRKAKNIFFTMFESSRPHPSFLEKIERADELWLPSKFNVEAIENLKVKPEVVHIPLGVDTSLYKSFDPTQEQESFFKIVKKSFSFISVFGWSLRKGVDILFKSYLQEFTKDDDVSLVVASRLNGGTSLDNIQKLRSIIADYIKRWCPDPQNHPHIVHIGSAIPEEKLPILYNMCDCFILPSRGEGFGLPYVEAGACEIPVVATRCGGQLDFLTDDNSFLLDIEGYDEGTQEIKEISSYYEGVPFAVLGNKCVAQLKETMRNVYNNYGEAQQKAGILRKNIENNYTWDHTVQKICERLNP
jgi:glycosyltransferase involved in cell wall biosynthesis